MRSLWVLVALSLVSPMGWPLDWPTDWLTDWSPRQAEARSRHRASDGRSPARGHDRHKSDSRERSRGHKTVAGHRQSASAGERSRSGNRGGSIQSRRSSHKRGRGKRREVFVPPPMPARIDVLSTDAMNGMVQVQLTGPLRPPHARLFVLTDSRGRRFVPAQAECYAIAETAAATSPDAIPALPHWRCAMSIAPAYRHSPVTGVSMEWGDRIVRALPGQVRARFATTGDVTVPTTPEPEGQAASPASENPAPPTSEAPTAPVRPDGEAGTPPAGAGPGEAEPVDPTHPEPEDTRPE